MHNLQNGTYNILIQAETARRKSYKGKTKRQHVPFVPVRQWFGEELRLPLEQQMWDGFSPDPETLLIFKNNRLVSSHNDVSVRHFYNSNTLGSLIREEYHKLTLAPRQFGPAYTYNARRRVQNASNWVAQFWQRWAHCAGDAASPPCNT